MTTSKPSLPQRVAGVVLGMCALSAISWFVFGKFTLDLIVNIMGGGAALCIVFGWVFEVADGRSTGGRIAALWLLLLVVWFLARWLLDIHPWRT